MFCRRSSTAPSASCRITDRWRGVPRLPSTRELTLSGTQERKGFFPRTIVALLVRKFQPYTFCGRLDRGGPRWNTVLHKFHKTNTYIVTYDDCGRGISACMNSSSFVKSGQAPSGVTFSGTRKRPVSSPSPIIRIFTFPSSASEQPMKQKLHQWRDTACGLGPSLHQRTQFCTFSFSASITTY